MGTHGLLLYGLVVVCLLLGFPLVTRRGRESVDETEGRWQRLAAWLVEQVNPEPEPDPVADELRRVLRRERLRSDLRRLQSIIATDENMSATRQIANRLAYQWLLREFDVTRSLLPPVPLDGGLGTETSSRSAPPLDWRTPDPQPSRNVEVLEIGWRR